MHRGITLAFIATGLVSLPQSVNAGRKLNDLMRALEDANEQAAADRDEEMRRLVGPEYNSEPEIQFSANSREAEMNISPKSIIQTEHNGRLALLHGTDRDVGAPQKTAVGAVAWATFDYYVRPAIRLKQAIDIKASADAAYSASPNAAFTFDELGTCTVEKLGFLKGVPKKRICLYDMDGDGKAERLSGIGKFSEQYSPTEPIEYRVYAKSAIASKLRRELVYLGHAQGVIRFAYREFTTNLIRPAFTTEMTYTLEPAGPTTIRFQQTVIRVDKVTNEGIDYTVTEA